MAMVDQLFEKTSKILESVDSMNQGIKIAEFVRITAPLTL